LPRKALRRFKNLPVVPEVALVGVAALMLLVLLSPVALLVAVLVFGVSLTGLVVRMGPA
jgi:hypothetical protein